MKYANDTELVLENGPFACRYVAGRAMCSDGKVRAVRFRSGIADTFFSIPASVKVNGKTVAGFVTVETEEGWSTPSEDDPAIVKFIAYQYRKNRDSLPLGAWKREPVRS
jgi:hypothetical protein